MPLPRLTVLVTFDLDAVALWVKGDDVAMRSRGELGVVAVPRLLRLLDDRGIPATWFVPGITARSFPDVVDDVVAAGHELGHHGWIHERFTGRPADEQRRILERGTEALVERTGHRPSGFRAPGWSIDDTTIAALVDLGFAYDSSLFGHDHRPYRCRIGDTVDVEADVPFVPGPATDLVEVPVSWSADDFPHFEYIPGRLHGLSPPSAVREIWLEDLRYAHEHEPGGFYMLTLHPQVIGRGHRLRMLADLLDEAAGLDGVEFATVGAHVAAWAAAQ